MLKGKIGYTGLLKQKSYPPDLFPGNQKNWSPSGLREIVKLLQ